MNDQTIPTNHGRQEDVRFVSGHGRYTADIVPENSLYAVFLRSYVAAGTITRLDCRAARAAPGVVAVLTADEAAADGVGQMIWTGAPVRDDGGSTPDSPRPTLSGAEIRHLGEPVAMVAIRLILCLKIAFMRCFCAVMLLPVPSPTLTVGRRVRRLVC